MATSTQHFIMLAESKELVLLDTPSSVVTILRTASQFVKSEVDSPGPEECRLL